MGARRRDQDERPEDLEVPREEAHDVKGGVAVGDVDGDGPAFAGGDPDRPIIAAKLPGLHKAGDVTLKRG